MGFFSRNESSGSSGRRSSSRTSSEAQAAELRVRARRRLIGALVLVLTAVIFVPMLFDAPPEEDLPTPVVLPESLPPVPAEPQVALAPEPPAAPAAGTIQAPATPEPAQAGDQAAAQQPGQPQTAAQPQAPAAEPQQPELKPEPRSEAAKPASSTATPASGSAANGRTDDGSVALALLEGRQPPQTGASAAPQKGNFVLQVAAYTTEADAQGRREKLAAAGVTNAYVEQAVANDKTAYRLRVGPFPTRDAAEAAQARLRQLGYNNGLIFNK